MQENAFLIESHRNHVVVVVGPILDEQDGWMSASQAFGQRGDRSGRPDGLPASAPGFGHEHIVGDAVGGVVHERGELVDCDPAIAPVTQHHRERGATTQHPGLRQVRHVDRRRDRIQDGATRLRVRRSDRAGAQQSDCDDDSPEIVTPHG